MTFSLKMELPRVPDGTRIQRTVIDDTLPNGPVERVIEYVAPFGLANREADYRVAWAFFENKTTVDTPAHNALTDDTPGMTTFSSINEETLAAAISRCQKRLIGILPLA